MKLILGIIITAATLNAQAMIHEGKELKVIIQPKWKSIDNNNINNSLFGGKWILAGTITFKKKTLEPLCLSKLELRWNGPTLNKLIGSLYEKPNDKEFMAIEDALLCDGFWNTKTQTLILKFNKQKTLSAVNTFCVVLTVPAALEETLRHGSFDITTTSLPEPIALQLQDSLRLSLDVADPSDISIKK